MGFFTLSPYRSKHSGGKCLNRVEGQEKERKPGPGAPPNGGRSEAVKEQENETYGKSGRSNTLKRMKRVLSAPDEWAGTWKVMS